jgi:hypothetical protein
MLKSSSLCLYSSNLGAFWLKIEQFWPFEEISIPANLKSSMEWSFELKCIEIGLSYFLHVLISER